MKARAHALLLALCALLVSVLAQAHPTPGSTALLDFTVDGARLEQDVPFEELERALHQRLIEPDEQPERAAERHAALFASYAAEHVRVVAQGSQAAWAVQTEIVEGHTADDGPRVRLVLRLTAPAGEASRSVALHDDIVGREVVSHQTQVFLRSDWGRGQAAHGPALIGTLHAGRNDLAIERKGSFWSGFVGVIALGAEHIATGTDHLLFLLTLLLVAPVVAVARSWQSGHDSRRAFGNLLRVVTAFTIGHSLTLALGALGLVALPGRFVEAAIAISIMVAALHAHVPLFPRREAWIAGLFGLVHGLAFASVLVEQHLGRAQAMWTLLGFNLGIELAQLAVLCVVAPWVLLLAKTNAYGSFRVGGGVAAIALAAGWLLERTTTHANPLAPVLALVESHPVMLLALLASTAILAIWKSGVSNLRSPGAAQ